MPRRKKTDDSQFRIKELRKIAGQFRDLADTAEREERNREIESFRKAKKVNRSIHYHRTAGALLMETLSFGGPQDERLRLILHSWKDRTHPGLDCFQQVCKSWRPLKEARIVPSYADMGAFAVAFRLIARAIAPVDDAEKTGG